MVDKSFPDIYYDGSFKNNPCIFSPNATFAIFFAQTMDSLNGDVDRFKRFVENAISRFRHSRRYKNYKEYLYNLGFDYCQILSNINSDMADIEMHHNGITIFDIGVMITRHLLAVKGQVTTFDVVMHLKYIHAMNYVPLVMLCKTMHQMVHNEDEFFIPASMTFGFWPQLLNEYSYGITFGIAKKLYYWIKISLEHTNDPNLNKNLIKIRDKVQKWSEYNEYVLNTNDYNRIGNISAIPTYNY